MESWAAAQEGACASAFQNLLEGVVGWREKGGREVGVQRDGSLGDGAVPCSGG